MIRFYENQSLSFDSEVLTLTPEFEGARPDIACINNAEGCFLFFLNDDLSNEQIQRAVTTVFREKNPKTLYISMQDMESMKRFDEILDSTEYLAWLSTYCSAERLLVRDAVPLPSDFETKVFDDITDDTERNRVRNGLMKYWTLDYADQYIREYPKFLQKKMEHNIVEMLGMNENVIIYKDSTIVAHLTYYEMKDPISGLEVIPIGKWVSSDLVSHEKRSIHSWTFEFLKNRNRMLYAAILFQHKASMRHFLNNCFTPVFVGLAKCS